MGTLFHWLDDDKSHQNYCPYWGHRSRLHSTRFLPDKLDPSERHDRLEWLDPQVLQLFSLSALCAAASERNLQRHSDSQPRMREFRRTRRSLGRQESEAGGPETMLTREISLKEIAPVAVGAPANPHCISIIDNSIEQ